jgi:hypothetical protein
VYRSVTTPEFWKLFDGLPEDIQKRAEKQYKLFSSNPAHPSLHLKQIGELWSVRVTDHYRALALLSGHVFTWVWIGSHREYERIIG